MQSQGTTVEQIDTITWARQDRVSSSTWVAEVACAQATANDRANILSSEDCASRSRCRSKSHNRAHGGLQAMFADTLAGACREWLSDRHKWVMQPSLYCMRT